MDTLKKAWVTPKAFVEEFTPNEYVSACWEVACETTLANQYETDYNPGFSHDPEACGKATNQYLTDASGSLKMYEKKTGQEGWDHDPECNLTNATYSTSLSLDSVTAGQYIYWTTSLVGQNGKTSIWHHRGQVVPADSSHPNRS